MISVIIPTYNRASLIKRAILSVLSQTFQDIEVIVVDDCSVDNTYEVVQQFHEKKVRYIKLNQNSGACVARNEGIKNAKGDIITFLDSDDEWFPQKLEVQYRYLKKKEADIVVCNYLYEKKGKLKKAFVKPIDLISYDQLLYSNCITTGAMMVKKNVFEKVGNFDEQMPRYQDWEFVLRVSKEYPIYYISEPLLTLHFQNISISSSTSMAKKYFALERIYEKNQEAVLRNPKAYAHICWSMGLYSLYGNKIRIDLLKKGTFENGVHWKRFLIFIAIRCGLKNVVLHVYAKNH